MMQKDNLKELAKTKTFWTGLGLIGYGIVELINGNSNGFQEILNGLAFIFLRSSLLEAKNGN